MTETVPSQSKRALCKKKNSDSLFLFCCTLNAKQNPDFKRSYCKPHVEFISGVQCD